MNDMSSPPSENTWKIRPFAETLAALHFLTRLPIPFVRTLDLPPLAEAMRFFPLAGAIIGAIISAVLIGANMLGLPSLLAAALALAAGVLVTGALHEDGLADVADGFGGGRTREHRLEIMRDSRIGTYGTIALCLTFIARAAIYETLAGRGPLDNPRAFGGCGGVFPLPRSLIFCGPRGRRAATAFRCLREGPENAAPCSRFLRAALALP